MIVLMLPDLTDDGVLPAGVHLCTWDELSQAFGWTARRKWLLEGLKVAAVSLRDAGCKLLYVDGSFVTRKDEPGDYDGCWEAAGVNPQKLDPILLRFDAGRLAQKTKFRGELFVAHFTADPQSGLRYLEFFQQDKDGNVKGLVALDLGSVP